MEMAVPIDAQVSLQGILAPGRLSDWRGRVGQRAVRAMREGMRDARPQTDAIMAAETAKAFVVRHGSKMQRAWRGRVADGKTNNPKLVITNLAKWFGIHVRGGTIGPRTTPRAILVPINTRGGTRIGTKKFYRLVEWLMREKLTLIKDGILYVKPPRNESARGGVKPGSRVQKRFRARFQGSAKRPSGFEIKLNDKGFTAIAVVRTSITMRKRMDLPTITRQKLLPVVKKAVLARL